MLDGSDDLEPILKCYKNELAVVGVLYLNGHLISHIVTSNLQAGFRSTFEALSIVLYSSLLCPLFSSVLNL